MQLYKIARSIQNCFKTPTGEYIDTDTGEVLDEEYLNGLRKNHSASAGNRQRAKSKA